MEKGSTSLLSKKIRVYPETALAKTWFQWISADRWCFNQAISILKTEKIGKYDLRKMVMDIAPSWVNPTPYNPRQLAIFQAFEAHKAAKKSGGDAKFRSALVVLPEWRDRGLGTLLTQHLIQQASHPLYLECLGTRLAQFYRHFGFVCVSWQELPRSLKFKFGLSHCAKVIFRIPVEFMTLSSD